MKTLKKAGIALLAAAALALAGCASESAGENTQTAPAPAAATTQAECEGVWTVVDFGALEADTVTACVETEKAITAIEAFEQAGFELEGVKTSDMFFACRIEGEPAADEPIEYSDASYTADCNDFGPEWAFWGLYIDTDGQWDFASEGAETQLVEPGQAVAFAWQFGEGSGTRLPEQG